MTMFRLTVALKKVCYVQPDLQVMPKKPHAVVLFEQNYIRHSVPEWRNWLRENMDITTTIFSNTVALIPKPGSDTLFSAAVILMEEDEVKV